MKISIASLLLIDSILCSVSIEPVAIANRMYTGNPLLTNEADTPNEIFEILSLAPEVTVTKSKGLVSIVGEAVYSAVSFIGQGIYTIISIFKKPDGMPVAEPTSNESVSAVEFVESIVDIVTGKGDAEDYENVTGAVEQAAEDYMCNGSQACIDTVEGIKSTADIISGHGSATDFDEVAKDVISVTETYLDIDIAPGSVLEGVTVGILEKYESTVETGLTYLEEAEAAVHLVGLDEEAKAIMDAIETVTGLPELSETIESGIELAEQIVKEHNSPVTKPSTTLKTKN